MISSYNISLFPKKMEVDRAHSSYHTFDITHYYSIKSLKNSLSRLTYLYSYLLDQRHTVYFIHVFAF